MSVFTSAGPKRLFGFAAFAAVCLTLIFLSGCGHRCGCNKCKSSSSCNTCKTCGVSDASTCTTCNQYANVGTAPQTLSESTAYQTPSTYNSSTTYSGTNTSFDRVGDSQNLPVFSAPITTAVTPPAYIPPAPPIQQASVIPDAQVRGGGQYHTLAQGETIYALSRKYGVKPKTILDANHFSDPNHLAVGTRVYIPAN